MVHSILSVPSDAICRHRGRLAEVVAAAAALTLAALAAMVLLPATAHAEGPSVEGMLDSADAEDELEADARLPEPTVAEVNVGVQWQLWRQSIDGGDPGFSELEKMRSDSVSIGRPSLPHHQLAMLHELRRDQDRGLDDEDVFELMEQAHDLAPHLPYAQLDLASARMLEGVDSSLQALPAYLDGVQQGALWLDTRVGWGLKIALWLLTVVGIAFLGFLLAQLLRYFGITAYDGTRVLPPGFSSTQTVILLVALVLVPGLLLQAPLLSMLLLLVLVIPFQQLNERIVSIGFLAVLAALPMIDDQLGKFVTYPGSDAQQLLHAHYHGCDDDCRAWLDELAGEDYGPARYAERTALYRTGSHEAMEQLENWFGDHDPAAAADELTVHWMSLEAAVLIARGESQRALEILDQAVQIESDEPAPWFNKGRAHQIQDEGAATQQSMRNAFERDLDAVSRNVDLSGQDPHSFLMVPSIDSTTIWRAHTPSGQQAPSLVAPVWTVLAGEDIELQYAFWLGLAGILLVMLTLPLKTGRRVSSPCPKCGLARDPTEAADTGHHHYCLPCYQTFVSGASLDYHARVHSEKMLGRRDRIQGFIRRVLSVVTPGMGHVQGGHAIRGTLAFGLVVTGVLILLSPLGPTGAWRGAFELFHQHWAGQSVVAWVLISLGGSVGLTGLINGVRATRVSPPSSDAGGDS